MSDSVSFNARACYTLAADRIYRVELRDGFVADRQLVSVVGAGIVEAHHFRDPLPGFGRNPLQNADQSGDRIIRDDEDSDFHFARDQDSAARSCGQRFLKRNGGGAGS